MALGAQSAYAEEDGTLELIEQAQQVDQAAQQQAADDQLLEVEEIVVTGSRLSRDNAFTSLTPTVSVSSEELGKRGFTNVADALSEIPGFAPGQGPTNTTEQSSFAAGVNFPDMFGLGTQRTLTLVDGKRFVSSNPPSIQGLAGGIQVDLNNIPLALIDRVETVGVGGSPIYGTDAVAGTVNIIMKDDYEGFEIQGQYGVIEKGGDPESYQAQMAWGANTADGKGNVAVGLEWNRSNAVVTGDFPDIFGPVPSFEEIANARDVNGDGDPDDVFQLFDDPRLIIVGPPGEPLLSPTPVFAPNGPPLGFTPEQAALRTNFANADGPLMIDKNGNLIPFDTGTFIPGNGIFTSGGNGLDLDLFGNEPFGNGNVSTKSERVVGMVNAHYGIFDWLETFGQFNFANTENLRPIVQDEHQTFVFPDEQQALGISITNPFLSDEARQGLIEAGVNNPTPEQIAAGAQPGTVFLSRNLNDVSDNGRSFTEAFTWRFVGGVRGDFEVAGRNWNYEVSLDWGQSDVDSNEIGLNDGRFFNAVNAIRLTEDDIQSVVDLQASQLDPDDFESQEALLAAAEEAALDSLDTFSGTDDPNTGDIICQAVLQRARGEFELRSGPAGNAANDVIPDVDGCVPLNLFGTAGPQEALDFVQAHNVFQSELKQRVFTLSLSGEVVELPAGWVEVVAGYETRRERGSLDTNEGIQIGLGREDPVLPTAGEFSTDEAFFELRTPIIDSDMRFGEDLFGFQVIDRLTLEGAARVVDNSFAGRDTTWTAGGRLAFGGFMSDLMIRGNFTRSVRSPSITELFSPVVETNEFAEDPCDFQFRDEGPARENRQANCSAVGLGPDFVSVAVNASREGSTGGNPNLENEKADSFTVGGVLTPRWIPGLSLSTDFIQVAINDRITTLTLTDLLEACFDQDPSNFDPNAGVCTTFERDGAGQIIDFSSGLQNAAESLFKGIQFQTRYDFSLTDAMEALNDSWGNFDWGNVTINSRAFHRIVNSFSVIGEQPDKVVGLFTEPKWSGTFDFTWTRGPAQFFWRVDWRDSSEFDPNGDNFFEDRDGNIVDGVSARIINNAAFSYTFFDNVTAQISVDNIFSTDANDLQLARTEFSGGAFGIDEIFGRQYRFRVTSRF